MRSRPRPHGGIHILDGWNKGTQQTSPIIPVPRSLLAKVKEGKLGRKTGEGFFKWKGDKKI